jgi:hypothetical protein
MTKRNNTYYAWLGELSRHGWDADKTDSVKFNHGSETEKHAHAKTATCLLLKDHGYRVDTEVTHAERGEIDVIAIPCDGDEHPFCIELETSPTEDTISDKVDRYHDGTPFRDIFIINVSELPTDILEMRAQIAAELGFQT